MDLLRQFFLNPGMLVGGALVSIPIIIYLINRQKHVRRYWAAMEFLLRAMRRNRRRIQLQNLLLLLIRTAIILLLVLAAARPVSRLGVLSLAPDESRNWLFAVDTSYSMGFQEDARSTFDQARETILRMMDGLIKPGDQVALMTIEQNPRIRLAPTDLSDQGGVQLRERLDELRLTSGAVDLGASFAVLDELCGKFATALGEAQPKRVIIFSDLQRKDWLAADRPKEAGLPQYIHKIQQEGGSFAFASLSDELSHSNLAITHLEISPALIARDVWVELRATIKNFGDEDFSNVDFTLRVDQDPADPDSESQVGEVIRVGRGETLPRSLPYKFTTSGYHTVIAELRSDGLVVDNRRYLAVRVEEDIKVLLVDGDPTGDPLERETFHLEVALQPEDDAMGAVQGRFTPFEPVYVTPDQLDAHDFKEYEVVILANVGELTAEQADGIKRYVRSGGALIVFLGANVQRDFYHRHFRATEAGGDHLLPFLLDEIRGDPRYPVNLQISDARHPIAAYFDVRKDVTRLHRPIISFYKYYNVKLPEDGASAGRIAFNFTDTEKSPAVFDNAYGAGRVLWVTSSADLEWNDFARWPDFVVFLYETISYLVEFGMTSSNLTAGTEFRKTYAGTAYASDVQLLTPLDASGSLERTRSVRKAMRNLPGGNQFDLTHEDTEVPGLYRLDLKRPNAPGTDTVEYFAVNVDTAESDMTSMTAEDFQTHFQELDYQVIDAAESIQDVEDQKKRLGGREYWKWVMGCVLFLLLLETFLAYLFGRRVK
jgi:hypothetical protein